jgi:tRNA A37 methylthiotransferase MiaB
MKTISFVTPNFNQGPKELNAYYLPYSTGLLWSYCSQFTTITDKYQLGEFIWRRDNTDLVVDKLKTHDIVGFSTYIWNRNYNYTVAKKLKQTNPDIFIVFGGPEPAIEDPNVFKDHPYIDVIVVSEGEYTFKNLIESYPDYDSVDGLLINNNGNVIKTKAPVRIHDVDTIPSPYLSGLFDDLMKDNPDVTWNMIMETNRGCPYQCTFCDWGSLTYAKIKRFSEQRVYDEFDWLGNNKIDFVSITDANFGIFEERDSRIADKLIETYKTHGVPKSYTNSWAKNLSENGPSRMGLNLSVQSLDDDVLEQIKRKNLEVNKIKEIFEMCNQASLPLFTEVIIGLPGQTIHTFKETIYKLFRMNNHTGISIYQCQLLENAEMSLTQRMEHKISGSLVHDYIVSSGLETEINENIEIVISTKDMPREMMLDTQVFSWFINTFHINNLTTNIARFLYKFVGEDYSQFYEKLWSHIQSDPWFQNEIENIKIHYSNWTTIGKINHNPIGKINIHGWNLIHSTIIKIHNEQKYDYVSELIYNFMKNNYNLSENLLENLVRFQSNSIVHYNKLKQYPFVEEYDFNVLQYINGDSLLSNSTITYSFEFPENKNVTLERFCEQIYFYRRRDYGKTKIGIIV